MTQYSAFIFDLDGTLIDSAPDITEAINKFLIKHEKGPLAVKFVEKFIGYGPRKLIYDILLEAGLPHDEESLQIALTEYAQNYRDEPATYTKFFPHVKEDLAYLKNKGFKLGICTNKPHELTHLILEKLEIASLIDVAIGADAVPQCKPHPDHLLSVAREMRLMDNTWAYIGDTEVDLQAANSAKAPFFLVPWGGGEFVSVDAKQKLTRLKDLAN